MLPAANRVAGSFDQSRSIGKDLIVYTISFRGGIGAPSLSINQHFIPTDLEKAIELAKQTEKLIYPNYYRCDIFDESGDAVISFSFKPRLGCVFDR